jgi:tetratricopeptide (TPR) repeat protein
MADQHSKQDEGKLEFTTDAEALGYISLDQATVLAIRNARDDTSTYGEGLAERELVWEVDRAEESEDYYRIFVSYRPLRGFVGEPGVEQFTIDKLGTIDSRLVLSIPRSNQNRRTWVTAAGILMLLSVVIGVLFVTVVVFPATKPQVVGTAVGMTSTDPHVDLPTDVLVLPNAVIPIALPTKRQEPTSTLPETGRRSPRTEDGWYLRGRSLQAAGDHVSAILQFAMSIDNLPGFIPAYEARSDSYWEIGDPDSALRDITRSIELEPTGDRYHQRGQRYQSLKNHLAAIDDYTRAIELSPGNPIYLASLDKAHGELKEVEDAVRD